VVVGIGRYRDPAIPAIETAEKDALEFAHLLEKAGVPEENLTILLGSNATLASIKAAVVDLRRQVTEPGDQGIVYFSGHGAPLTGEEAQIQDGLLVPFDGIGETTATLKSSCYPLAEFKEDLRIIAQPVFVFLEACFSGKGAVLGSDTLGIVVRARKEVEDRIMSMPGKPILSATSGDRFANSDSRKRKHGLFTYYLLQGLNGDGDLNGDGRIDLLELYGFVKGEVQKASKVFRSQEPELYNPEGVNAVLTTVP
jgi:uncharacterized caspase-like protein